MDLLQEYYERHNIKLPMVRHVDRNHLVFVTAENEADKTAKRYTVLSVSFSAKPDNHPGTFRFIQSSVIYDAGSMGVASSLRTCWDKKLEWDDYESFILTWAEANKGKVILLEQDRGLMVLWEMFTYSHDTWVSQNFSPRQIDMLCQVLDPDTKTDERQVLAAELEGVVKRNKAAFAFMGSLRTFCVDQSKSASWLADMLK